MAETHKAETQLPAGEEEKIRLSQEQAHKKYQYERHHTILEPIPQERSTHAIFSPSEYVSEYFKSTPVLSILKRGRKVVTVQANQRAADALNTLAREDILSCPVYDTDLQAFVGFVDYLDLVYLLVDISLKLMAEEFPNDASVTALTSDQRDRFISLLKQAFNSKSLFDISDLSKRDPFIPLQKGASLYQAIEILAKWGIHRVPIMDESGNVATLVAQSDVVDFLFSNLDKFPTTAKKLVRDCIKAHRPVVTVKETDLAFEAFISLVANRVSAVGIVDNNNTLLGVVSATDIRILGPHINTVGMLFLTVKEFFERAREFNPWTLLPLVRSFPTDTLGMVLEKMEDNCIHRVFVVDEQQKPLSVLSMKDVLLEFIR